jgi:amino acid permease
MTSTFASAIFLQFVGTVGSGIFVLPYVFYHSNFLFAAIFLVLLGFVSGALNRFYCHIVSSTKGDHQLAGYAEIYLGPRFKYLALLNLILLSFGAMTAYQKLFSSFLSALFPVVGNYSPYIFIGLLGLAIISKFKINRFFSILIPFFILLIPIVLFFYSAIFINHESYSMFQSPSFLFYGATIFALSGLTIVPEIDETLRRGRPKKHETLALASSIGVALVVITYLLFSYSIVTLSGPSVSINTVSGLLVNSPFFALVISIFGIITTFRASLNFIHVLHELFFRDLGLSESKSVALSFAFPLLTLVAGSIPLLTIISLTGNITIFVSALLVILIRFELPRSFWTEFFAILVLVCLSLGLLISFV